MDFIINVSFPTTASKRTDATTDPRSDRRTKKKSRLKAGEKERLMWRRRAEGLIALQRSSHEQHLVCSNNHCGFRRKQQGSAPLQQIIIIYSQTLCPQHLPLLFYFGVKSFSVWLESTAWLSVSSERWRQFNLYLITLNMYKTRLASFSVSGSCLEIDAWPVQRARCARCASLTRAAQVQWTRSNVGLQRFKLN